MACDHCKCATPDLAAVAQEAERRLKEIRRRFAWGGAYSDATVSEGLVEIVLAVAREAAGD